MKERRTLHHYGEEPKPSVDGDVNVVPITELVKESDLDEQQEPEERAADAPADTATDERWNRVDQHDIQLRDLEQKVREHDERFAYPGRTGSVGGAAETTDSAEAGETEGVTEP